jgi:hypothetical protein
VGQPAHELKDYITRFGLKMRSANFTLYGDMSDRVVSILRTFTPRLEAVRGLLRGMLKKGYAYKKCGGGLLDLSRPEDLQRDLFKALAVT